MTTGVELLRHATTIIHHDGELVLAWFQSLGEVVDLWGGDIVGRADEFAEAYKRFNDKMKNTMADYELVSLSKSQIVDLF